MASDYKTACTTHTAAVMNTKNEKNMVLTEDRHQRNMVDYLVIWFDPTYLASDHPADANSVYIRETINPKHSFSEVNELVDFVTDMDDGSVLLILSNMDSVRLLSVIQDLPQLHGFYILNGKTIETNQWQKCRGIFRTVENLAQVLDHDVRLLQRSWLPISILPNTATLKRELNELPACFLYSQILKEISLGFDDHQCNMEDLVQYLYEQNVQNERTLSKINDFQWKYSAQSAIYWYSKEDFLFRILNQSLRELDTNVVIKMIFFIRDLHQRIKQLSDQQKNSQRISTVYRGQLMFIEDFNQLRHNVGGLLSFNSFLSTSLDRAVMEPFSDPGPRTDVIGVCFEIQLDPNQIRTPFAFVMHESHFQDEEEVLFSMNSVFRIAEVVKTTDTHQWYVKLTSTPDDDETLSELTNFIRHETRGPTGFHRLGQLLIRMGRWEGAAEIYQELLRSTSSNDFIELALLNNQLGYIWHEFGDHDQALAFYRRSLEITERSLPTDFLDRAKALNNMGSVEASRGHYTAALPLFQQALAMHRLSPIQKEDYLATFYQNIGNCQNHMGNLQAAMVAFTQVQRFQQKSLPTCHPAQAVTLNNLGQVSDYQGQYQQALDYYQQALTIQQRSLLPNHSDLAGTYNNIGDMQGKLGLFSKGIKSLEAALHILEESRMPNRDIMALTYNNMGVLYYRSQNYNHAVKFYQKALNIQTAHLPLNHPKKSQCCNNIAQAYKELQRFDQALEFAQRALSISKNIDPPIYRDQAQIYDNIGSIYYSMGNWPQALSYHQEALNIHNTHIRSDHPDIARVYSNIGQVQDLMGHRAEALHFFERAREIGSKCLPENHPERLFYEANIRNRQFD